MAYLSNRSGLSKYSNNITDATTSRVAGITDTGKYIRFTNAGAKTYTVAPQASVEWVIGTVITVRNAAAGELTFVEGAGVTITPNDITLEENGTAQVILVSENNWDFI